MVFTSFHCTLIMSWYTHLFMVHASVHDTRIIPVVHATFSWPHIMSCSSADHVRTISSLRRSNECTVRRGIQSLPSTTLVQKSWAASATWGSAKPPGGAKAQHLTLKCMSTFNAYKKKKKKKRRRRRKKIESSGKPVIVHPLGRSLINADKYRFFFASQEGVPCEWLVV